jgi:aminoglycoside phosphotransferase
LTRRHSDRAGAAVPLPLLAIAHRAVRRVRTLRAGSTDRVARAHTVLAEQGSALATQTPLLNLEAARLLAASEDRFAYRVTWDAVPAVLKLALTPSADRRLRREGRVLQIMERRGLTRSPQLLAQGQALRGRFQVESLLPGRAAASAPSDAEPLLVPAARLLAPIHARTAAEVVVDDRWLERHAHRPIAQIHAVLHAALGQRGELARLASLGPSLHAALAGRPLRVALTHGDFWLQNMLLDEQGAPSGIVDWDSAGCAPPAIDALHLVLYGRKQRRRGPLGAELGRMITTQRWSAVERDCLELLAPELLDDGSSSLAWLYWLRFVTGNVTRHPSLANDVDWVIANVALPLRHA